MTAVKVGQVWRDKDKRRNTVIEIIATDEAESLGTVIGLVVGTEEERIYKVDHLLKRWELIKEKTTHRLLKEIAEGDTEPKKRVKIVKGVIYPGNTQEFDKNEQPTGYVLLTEQQIKDLKPAPKKVVGRTKIHETREQWLNEAVLLLGERLFSKHKLPFIRVSVGWPRRARRTTIGQCFISKVSEDKSSQIFISPKLVDPVAPYGVLATLAHEMIHAIDDCENGHKARFKSIALEIGLTGKMTATFASDELIETLKELAEQLGEYPHSKINIEDQITVQKTYMLKVVSKSEPDYKLRMTQKMIDEYGLPRDPWGEEMEVEES